MTKAVFMAVAAKTPALRLVEIDRDETSHLPSLFELLRQRPERFVVLCDDLSFEDGAAEAKALKSALEQVNGLQNQAGEAAASFERGETTDIAGVMLAKQQASVSFEATLQVRNKLLSAYKDIMSMPV